MLDPACRPPSDRDAAYDRIRSSTVDPKLIWPPVHRGRVRRSGAARASAKTGSVGAARSPAGGRQGAIDADTAAPHLPPSGTFHPKAQGLFFFV